MLVRASEVGEKPAVSSAEVPESVSPQEAAVLFATNCGRCHGQSGKGDGPDSAQMNVPVPDMTKASFVQSRNATHLLEVIRDGGPAKGLSPMMPPWGKLFSDAEMRALVEYVQKLSTR